MSRTTVVVFDLDDTLYPEREYAFSGFDAVAAAFSREFGGPQATSAALRRLFDTEHRRRVFDALMEERDLPDDGGLIERMVHAYRTHTPRIALHSDAAGLLTRLNEGFELGLITDGPAAMQWAKIDALNLRPVFREIIVTGEWGSEFSKPHPRAFETMCSRMGVAASACAYVADNPAKDFIAPNALGWLTVQITRPDGIYRDERAPEPGIPQRRISSLDELESLLS